jgi:3',5'-cyclic AMP phosphodiesterase CpdA
MRLLDGKVPYSVSPGNHDMSSKGKTTYFNQFFPVERFSSAAWFGGSYPSEKNDNSYYFFSAAGKDFMIMQLGFCPDSDAIEWANNVLQANSGKKAIIVTHAFLGPNAERNVHASKDSACNAPSNNTQYLWDELIYPNANVFLVLCGHVHGEARRVDKNAAGKPVYQLLADYQSGENGGNGWLRILEFSPAQNKIFVKTFSPYLNEFETDYDSQFELPFEAS